MEEYLVQTNTLNDRVQKIYRFPNGYGASVIKGPYTYGGSDDKWELAVISDFNPNFPDSLSEGETPWEINYQTGITDDVFGHLEDPDVHAILNDIARLSDA